MGRVHRRRVHRAGGSPACGVTELGEPTGGGFLGELTCRIQASPPLGCLGLAKNGFFRSRFCPGGQ